MRSRLAAASCRAFTFVFLAGCCSDPEDPEDPGATKQAEFVDAWLDDLAEGRDADALQRLRIIGPPPAGWNLARFGARVDRLALRSATQTKWTKAHYLLNEVNPNSRDPFGDRVLTCLANSNPALALDGSFEAEGVSHLLHVVVFEDGGSKVGRVSVDGRDLLPSDDRTIVTAPVEERDPDDLLLGATLELRSVGPTSFLWLGSPLALPSGASARLQADCEYGDRWYRHAIVSSLPGPLELSAGLRSELPERCAVDVTVNEGSTAQSRSWCWRPAQTDPGPCDDRPQPGRRSKDPVFVDHVAPRLLDDGSFSITYDLHANESLPQAGDPQRNHLALTLRCGQQAPRRVTRPLNGDLHPSGVFQSFAALYGEAGSAIDMPCDLQIELSRESPYERERWVLFEGCVTLDQVVAGACSR